MRNNRGSTYLHEGELLKMTLQINPWDDDSYEKQLSVEEKIREKRIELELLRKSQPHDVPSYNRLTGPEDEEDWMYVTNCPLCEKECLVRIDYPVCFWCRDEIKPFTMDFDDKEWYAKVPSYEDTKTKCKGIKYAVIHKKMVTDELGFRRVIGQQSLITHFVKHTEGELADVLDALCIECFTNIWKDNTCHICLKEATTGKHDLCKVCEKENPNYDPRESLIEKKLEIETLHDEVKKSLQKRKDYNAKRDVQEEKFLASKRKSREAKK